MTKKYILLLIFVILLLPTFVGMLKYGIYTMQDFHIFRQFEFGKCIEEGVFPCRWAPDAGMGYGEPVFNFYGQFPYWIGEVFHLSGFSVIDSVKIVFILSLVLSAWAMYSFSSKYWGKWGGMVSAIFYSYAPYRAVDVWVRGALSESLAFIFFPLILKHIDDYVDNRDNRHLVWIVICGASLIITHNLSLVIFAAFALAWWVYKCISKKDWRSIIPLSISAIVVLGLSAFYLLPVIMESHLITLVQTTQGYYDYRAHFATLSQLFVSRFWGYGASLWGPVDDLSLSMGQMHWILLGLVSAFYVVRPKETLNKGIFFLGVALFGLAIFLTHNKSTFIWNSLPFMAYIQFPWRFLSMAALFSSFGVGAIVNVFPTRLRIVSLLAIGLVIISNVGFFKPDIWREISDEQMFSGMLWDEQRASALSDYWPKNTQLPTQFAPIVPGVTIGSHSINVQTNGGDVTLPVVYFPGWKAKINGVEVPISTDSGLISFELPPGEASVDLKFTDTQPRQWGNIISIVTLSLGALWLFLARSRNSQSS